MTILASDTPAFRTAAQRPERIGTFALDFTCSGGCESGELSGRFKGDRKELKKGNNKGLRVTVRMLVANTAGYRDYVKVENFANQLFANPFRTLGMMI